MRSEAAQRLVLEALPTEGPGFRKLKFQQAMIESSIDRLDRGLPLALGVVTQALESQAEAN